MKFIKKLLVPVVMSAVLTTVSFAAFEKINSYTDSTFNDVPGNAWYASEVKSSYELGLFGGKGEGKFDPSGRVTVAEAVTLASRAASIYAGETIPETSGAKWYDMYLEYAKSKNFLSDGQFDNFDRPAKRHEVASLFAKAMPDGYYTAKNDVDAVPDVFSQDSCYADVLMLYKAGIVMGSDSYGNFKPQDNITRAECAAIINRVALDENRVEGTLDKYSDDDAYLLVYNTSMEGFKEGVNSGWRLDNTGGVPRTALEGGYGSLTDVSETSGTALIREFNKTTTGKVSAELSITVSERDFDGVIIEFRNDKDAPVYKIVTENGAWKYVCADGSKKVLFDKASAVQNFKFRITVDLDNNRANTVINKKDCGSFELITKGEDTNLLNFRYATADKETPAVALGRVKMTVNYGINDDFELESDGTLPYGWTGNGVCEDELLKVAKGNASKSFEPLSGQVCTDVSFKLDKSQSAYINLSNGGKKLISITSDSEKLYANGKEICEYVPDMWYRLRIDADTFSGKADIYLNGRVQATADFLDAATSIDTLTLGNNDSDSVEFDTVKAFVKKTHEDYVPVPVKPAGTDDYYVGLNICSLWVNGTHYGWSCISAHEDHIPVLGLYDEGLEETADWEIKFMLEHGIDFQAFCWYPDFGDAPIKEPKNGAQLYDAFVYSKYSHMTNYCLLWEARNSQRPTSFESFKKYYVPYIIEYFLKDSRYMVIDNRPVLSVYGQDYLAKSLGGNAVLKSCLDYLEQEAKKLGFDGMIYLCCGTSCEDFYQMGFDGTHAYGWGTAGSSVDVNKNNILKSASFDKMYTVPTISVGFNSRPWHGVVYDMMTVEDYRTAHDWVKKEYLTTYPKEEWQKKLVWLSTWNEYGEGTYIMPSEAHVGFGYLDVIREAYTSEKADEKLNAVPTPSQKERINHLYPQYRKLLRKQGRYVDKTDESELITEGTIDFSNKEGIVVSHTSKFEFTEQGLVGTVIGDTHIITSGHKYDAGKITHLRINIDVPKGTSIQLFYTTDRSPNWAADKSIVFTADKEGFAQYLIETKTVSNWVGTVTGLRIDPGQSAAGVEANNFHITSIEFMTSPDVKSKKMTVNGKTYDMQLPYEDSPTGDLLFAFDPGMALDFILGTFHTWDAHNKQLTLDVNGHTLVYTVGKDTYTLDGKEKSLGYKLYTQDGLPLIPVEKFCADAGFKCSVDESGAAVIETHEKAYFDSIASRTKGHWDFETAGDNEGWISTFMNLATWEGALSAVSNSTHKDPTLNLSSKANLKAMNYVALEIRCRYKYEADKVHPMVLYFTTDRETKMDEAKTLRVHLKSTDSKGEWETYRIDITKVETWRNTIMDLRLDPFNAVGSMDIDYIRFIEGENEAAASNPPNGIKVFNGDAEADKHFFFSDNAEISIVTDPDNPDNRCYYVKAKDDSKKWYYIRQLIEYTPGTTYKATYDIKLASHGTSTVLPDDLKINITYNARYGGSAEASKDHVSAPQSTLVSSKDGWVKAQSTFTVSPKSDVRIDDQLAIYANPFAEKGVGFYIDNITIEEVKE